MRCNELKAKLASKDAEVKERTKNTIKCFELVKDFVIDKLIEDHIKDEFDGSGSYIYPKDVYDELFKKIDLNVSKLRWDYMSVFRGFDLSVIKYEPFLFLHQFDLEADGAADSMKEELKQHEDLEKFKKNFDGELFKKLIIDHVLKFGFKHKWIENVWGQQVKTDRFVISRSFLEKKCCSEQVKPFDGDGELNDNLIGAVVIVAICILAFIYFILARV